MKVDMPSNTEAKPNQTSLWLKWKQMQKKKYIYIYIYIYIHTHTQILGGGMKKYKHLMNIDVSTIFYQKRKANKIYLY